MGLLDYTTLLGCLSVLFLVFRLMATRTKPLKFQSFYTPFRKGEPLHIELYAIHDVTVTLLGGTKFRSMMVCDDVSWNPREVGSIIETEVRLTGKNLEILR